MAIEIVHMTWLTPPAYCFTQCEVRRVVGHTSTPVSGRHAHGRRTGESAEHQPRLASCHSTPEVVRSPARQ
eukprot:6887318-Alexandrium_andersonii.AAC.1